MDNSAGVSFDAMLFAIAAFSLISEPESAVVDSAVVVGAVDATDAESAVLVAPAPNHDDTKEGMAVPALPVVP